MVTNKLNREGFLFCLVGPSGVGKSELSRKLLQKFDGLQLSISCTTRPPREGEKEGEHYFFLSRSEFEDKVKQGLFFEFEEVHGHLYGTLKSSVDSALLNGEDLLLDIDVKGALNFKSQRPYNTISVFILPPSFQELLNRIQGRSKMSQEELERRTESTREEYRSVRECRDKKSGLDYLLINDNLDQTFLELSAIVLAEMGRLNRVKSESLVRFLDVPGTKE